jgi:hypothetical protein
MALALYSTAWHCMALYGVWHCKSQKNTYSLGIKENRNWNLLGSTIMTHSPTRLQAPLTWGPVEHERKSPQSLD